mmetsp:Transcript_21179/g.66529  ORF Transcript_21179/g.66529 Transcript_21179/m.66529 type:complete len:356 (-) Transcript_21179:33-1100(-)
MAPRRRRPDLLRLDRVPPLLPPPVPRPALRPPPAPLPPPLLRRLPRRLPQPPLRRTPHQPPLLPRRRHEPRRRRPLSLREALQTADRDLLPSAGHLLRQLCLRRRHHRLPPGLAQLPGRAPPLARPLHALLPEGPAHRQSHLRQARRSLRPAERLQARHQTHRHHGRQHLHAQVPHRLRAPRRPRRHLNPVGTLSPPREETPVPLSHEPCPPPLDPASSTLSRALDTLLPWPTAPWPTGGCQAMPRLAFVSAFASPLARSWGQPPPPPAPSARLAPSLLPLLPLPGTRHGLFERFERKAVFVVVVVVVVTGRERGSAAQGAPPHGTCALRSSAVDRYVSLSISASSLSSSCAPLL